MKYLVVLALTIVAVSARSMTGRDLMQNEEFVRNVDKMKEEFKGIDAVIKADPQAAAVNAMHFLNEVDDEIRPKIMQDSVKSMTAMLDTTKTIGQRFNEVAMIAQNTADLWKLAAKKYNENHPSVLA